MTTLWLDLETFSEADLKEVGGYRYAEDSTTEIMLWAYGINDEPAQVWDVASGDAMPSDLFGAYTDSTAIKWAHNAQFDRTVLSNVMDVFPTELTSWRCSMAMALSHALPASLAQLCDVLNISEDKRKLDEGKKLVDLFCKPRPKNHKLRRATRESHPEEWERFKQYAANDIEAMREAVRLMPRFNWNATTVAEWHLDQRINDRGFFVDRALVEAGARAAVEEKARLAARFQELTRHEVESPTQREKFRVYLNERFNLSLDNTTRDTFEHMIKHENLASECKELMHLSINANKNSTAKYAKLLPSIGRDGRYRGALQFAGAGRTRRWAGRGPQFQNLPSRGLPPVDEVDFYIECLKANTHTFFFENLMQLGAAALRGTVVAPPSKKLVVADLSNIEGRMLAWLAGEEWKIQAFRDFDAGTGPDLYNITAVSIIGGDPWNVDKKNRNVFGKVPDLASGYQGGVAGYQTFAHAYGVRMADHWDTIQKMIAPKYVEQARKNLERWGFKQLAELEIDEIEWIASETCKLAWRARHPATCQLWYELQDAAINAIQHVGQVFRAGQHLKLSVVEHEGNRWLLIRLPSGRHLTYFRPSYSKESGLTYWGEASEDGTSGKRVWTKIFTHGGKLTGNCCQATARDQLAQVMPLAENAGYTPILTVHDELIAEVPDNSGYTAKGLAGILATNLMWNPGLPLAAAGFEAQRYHKD